MKFLENFVRPGPGPLIRLRRETREDSLTHRLLSGAGHASLKTARNLKSPSNADFG
jgi:hypothetical protein